MRGLIKKQVGWIVCAVMVIVMLPMMTEDVSAEDLYEIIWQYSDGSVIDITKVAYGTVPSHENPIMEPTPEYTYTFVSWNPEVSIVDGPAVYTAIFNQTKNKYAVRFDTYGGTGADG